MKLRGLLFGFFLLVTSAVGTAYCQGMGYGAGPGRMNPPAPEVTVGGTVEQVRTMTSGRGWSGTHLDLKTETGVYDVHLGPSSYVESQGFKFAKGDTIQVTGWKQSFQGRDAIVAREIKTDGKVLNLRNSKGIPNWAGGRRSSGPPMGRGIAECPGCPMVR